jgi:hypothetical protein
VFEFRTICRRYVGFGTLAAPRVNNAVGCDRLLAALAALFDSCAKEIRGSLLRAWMTSQQCSVRNALLLFLSGQEA